MCQLRISSALTNWYRCGPERRYSGASRDEEMLMSDAESTVAVVKTTTVETTTIVVEPSRTADDNTAVPSTASTAPTAVGSVPTAAPSIAALMSRRFRGFLPVVVDVETGGFHSSTDALLEIAAVLIDMEPDGTLKRGATHSFHVKPFEGARLDPAALAITGIDPFHPLRPALPEK